MFFLLCCCVGFDVCDLFAWLAHDILLVETIRWRSMMYSILIRYVFFAASYFHCKAAQIGRAHSVATDDDGDDIAFTRRKRDDRCGSRHDLTELDEVNEVNLKHVSLLCWISDCRSLGSYVDKVIRSNIIKISIHSERSAFELVFFSTSVVVLQQENWSV